MTHDQLYEVFNAITLAALCWLIGERAGRNRGAYEGAKQAVRLLDEKGLIAAPDDEDDKDDES